MLLLNRNKEMNAHCLLYFPEKLKVGLHWDIEFEHITEILSDNNKFNKFIFSINQFTKKIQNLLFDEYPLKKPTAEKASTLE